MKLAVLFENAAPSLKLWQHVVKVQGLSSSIDEVEEQLEGVDIPQALVKAIESIIGAGVSIELTLNDVKRVSDRQLILGVHIDYLDLDGDSPNDVVCDLLFKS